MYRPRYRSQIHCSFLPMISPIVQVGPARSRAAVGYLALTRQNERAKAVRIFIEPLLGFYRVVPCFHMCELAITRLIKIK